MANCKENTYPYFEINWHIENFNFCWHKTGERLESPLFQIYTTCKTYWRFWLYPRGEDDGEYISCYIFRGDGGPEVVIVDFDLSLIVVGLILKPIVTFSKAHSFRCNQKEGSRCFASRWEVMNSVATPKEKMTLKVACKIYKTWHENIKKNFLTRIETTHMNDSEVFDIEADVDPKTNKDIEIKPILEDQPLVKINLSYTEESLIIKILPMSCQGIKYANIKITIIKSWEKESQIEHVRSWIGEIRTDIWRYHVTCPEEQFQQLHVDTFSHKSFFLHYQFAFSTGFLIEKHGLRECISYLKNTFIYIQQHLRSDSNIAKSNAPTALDALRDIYRSQCYIDFNVKSETKSYPAHKAILCARISKFRSLIKNNSADICIPTLKDKSAGFFMWFLYTDAVVLSIDIVSDLFFLAFSLNVDLLKTKCRKILENSLNPKTFYRILSLARVVRDQALETAVKNYFVTNYDLIIRSTNFLTKAKCDSGLYKLIFLKYKENINF